MKHSNPPWICFAILAAAVLDWLAPLETGPVDMGFAWAAAIPWIATAVGGIAGWLKSRNQNKGTQATDNTSTSVSTPTLDPRMAPVQSIVLRQVMQRLQQGGKGVAAGITNTRMSGINQLFNNIGVAQKNTLAANGMMNAGGGNQAAGAKINLDQARGGELAKVLAEEPLLEQDAEHQNLIDAMGLLSQGRGSTTTTRTVGTGVTSGTSTSGGGAGGALEGIGGILGMMYANGAFEPKPKRTGLDGR